MKIHPTIIAIICGAILSLQTWTLVETVNMKVQVAVLFARINLCKCLKP